MTSDSLDSGIAVVGLDNVALDLPIAGLGNRVLAAFMDHVILTVLSIAALVGSLGVLVAMGPKDRYGLALVLILAGLFIINSGYFIFFELVLAGQTPGKKILGIRVVTDSGGRPGAGALITRNLVRLIDNFIGVPMMAVDERSRRLGDRLAGTLVVHTRPVRQELIIQRLPAGWGARHAAVVESLLLRARGLREDRAEELAWRVLALAERDDPQFLDGLDRSGASVGQVGKAFGMGPG